jgi:predicted MPP superfamily phosphohydrolase
MGTGFTVPPEGEDIYSQLVRRVGEAHVRRRVALQAEHAARVLGRGRTLVHIENAEWLHVLIHWGLRLTGLYGLGRRNARAVQVRSNDVPIEGLPRGLDGFRLLHLSDLHLDLDPGLTDVIIERVQGLEVDLCVLTGDYRASTSGPHAVALEQTARLVGALEAPAYGVLGNHDFIEFVPTLEEAGLRMLLNETVVIEGTRGGRLHLSGVDDPHFYEADSLDKVSDGLPAGEPSVLLSHSPEIYRGAAAAGYDLMLCGHTHAGQICLPGGWPVLTNARGPRRIKGGPWRRGRLQGYTSPGVGTSGVPVRFFCPPVAAVHTLRSSERGSRP